MATPDSPEAAPRGVWLPGAAGPLAGWLSAPTPAPTPAAGATAPTGVLILPAIGYQYWSAHRTLRVLAERLADLGHVVLRLDHDGTGDSAQDGWAPGRVTAWRAGVACGVAELRARGCGRVLLVGVRLGATLALLEGAAVGADGVVAWAPVVSGRRFAKELRLLSDPVPPEADPAGGGTVVAAGTVFTAQTLADLAERSLAELDAAPAPRIAVVGGPSEAKAVAALEGLPGTTVEHLAAEDGESALERPTEYAEVPEDTLDVIVGWVRALPVTPDNPAAPDPAPPAPPTARFPWRGTEVVETFVRLGPDGLAAIVTEPTGPVTSATALFLNSGSEAHVGPGRAWVEYARDLATRGHRSVRLDFRGWGESPSGGFAPGRPYDPHAVEDVVRALAALRAAGHDRVVLVGLCASAWIALRAVLTPHDAAGVVALNPQLYWEPGHPVEATMVETRTRRTPIRALEARGGRTGLWDTLDRLGDRPWAAGWLDALVAAGTPVHLLFAEGDDGLEYLRNRVRRRLDAALASGTVTVGELPAIDHSMHRAWLRGSVVDALDAQLRRAGDARPPAPPTPAVRH